MFRAWGGLMGANAPRHRISAASVSAMPTRRRAGAAVTQQPQRGHGARGCVWACLCSCPRNVSLWNTPVVACALHQPPSTVQDCIHSCTLSTAGPRALPAAAPAMGRQQAQPAVQSEVRMEVRIIAAPYSHLAPHPQQMRRVPDAAPSDLEPLQCEQLTAMAVRSLRRKKGAASSGAQAHMAVAPLAA